jgi:hypothetical protein
MGGRQNFVAGHSGDSDRIGAGPAARTPLWQRTGFTDRRDASRSR